MTLRFRTIRIDAKNGSQCYLKLTEDRQLLIRRVTGQVALEATGAAKNN